MQTAENKVTKILVTGATGNVGSRVVRELRERGAYVRAFVRHTVKTAKVLGEAETRSSPPLPGMGNRQTESEQ